jgi:DNA-binding transcriptional MerR regulator
MAVPLVKKEELSRPSVLSRIEELSSRGLSEIEIIDTLRKEGYSPDEIDKGLTEALKMGATEIRALPPKPKEEPKKLPPPPPEPPKLPANLPAPLELPSEPMPQVPEVSVQQDYFYPEYSTEEYIDYMVKEKTEEINKKINEFMLKQKELESKILSLHEKLSEVSQVKTSEQQLIGTKIDSLKDLIEEMNVRLESLEKAFKETLPALIESIRALSELTQRLKG